MKEPGQVPGSCFSGGLAREPPPPKRGLDWGLAVAGSASLEHGESWTRPENIVSNGPLLLTKLGGESVEFVRNLTYFGDFTGNIRRYEWNAGEDSAEAIEAYSDNRADVVWEIHQNELAPDLPRDEIQGQLGTNDTQLLVLNPTLPPLDDVRVRRALAHAIDRTRIGAVKSSFRIPNASGGAVPPGMAGHSPEIGLEYDVPKALQYLESAGFPKGRGLPDLQFAAYGLRHFVDVLDQWKGSIGIEPEIIELPPTAPNPETLNTHIYGVGWVADYPDPDSFLRASSMYTFLKRSGWEGLSGVRALLEEALQSQDRMRRLELYRTVDHLLVDEEVLFIPISYAGEQLVSVAKPWVQGWNRNALELLKFEQISVEPHL